MPFLHRVLGFDGTFYKNLQEEEATRELHSKLSEKKILHLT